MPKSYKSIASRIACAIVVSTATSTNVAAVSLFGGADKSNKMRPNSTTSHAGVPTASNQESTTQVPNNTTSTGAACTIIGSLFGGIFIGVGSTLGVLYCGDCLDCLSKAPEPYTRPPSPQPPAVQTTTCRIIWDEWDLDCRRSSDGTRLERNYSQANTVLDINVRNFDNVFERTCCQARSSPTPPSPPAPVETRSCSQLWNTSRRFNCTSMRGANGQFMERNFSNAGHTFSRTPTNAEFRSTCCQEHVCPHFGSDEPVAEAPVDYLYNFPDGVDLSVELAAKGELELAAPEFSKINDNNKDGNFVGTWSVKEAASDGKLAMKSSEISSSEINSKKYEDFLWWESKLQSEVSERILFPALKNNQKKFVVKNDRDSLVKFFEKTLTHLGLNSIEIKDFTAYWLFRLGADAELSSPKFEAVEKAVRAAREIEDISGKLEKYRVDIIVDNDLNNVFERAVAKTALSVQPDFERRVFFVFSEADSESDFIDEGKYLLSEKLGEKVNRVVYEERKAKVFVEWGGMVAKKVATQVEGAAKDEL